MNNRVLSLFFHVSADLHLVMWLMSNHECQAHESYHDKCVREKWEGERALFKSKSLEKEIFNAQSSVKISLVLNK